MMKPSNIIKKNFLVFAFLLFYLSTYAYTETGGTITIEITNNRNTRGKISIGLYKSIHKQFDDKIKALKMIIVKIAGKKTVCTIEDVEPGKYAIAILHDEDEDGNTKFNFLGIPREGFGFSTNPSILSRSPYIDNCSFEVLEGENTTQEITLKYLL